MGAVAAGVSIISGIAGISAKNKQAQAQREAIQSQQYQQAVAAANQQAQLEVQLQLNRQEYQTGILSRLAAYQQGVVGLAAQDIQSQLAAQAQQQQIDAAALQQVIGAEQARGQLDREVTRIGVEADTRIGAAATKEAQILEQLTEAVKLTPAQRRNASVQAAGRLRSTSSDIQEEGGMLRGLSQALEAGLGIDRTAALAELQSLGEEEVALIMEQFGLTNTEQSFNDLATNLKLVGLSAEDATTKNQGNLEATRLALKSGKETLDFSRELQGTAAKDEFNITDFGLRTQQEFARLGNTALQSSFNQQQRNVRGAGLFDYLNFGLNTFGAVSPLLRQTPSIQAPQPSTLFSGFPTAFSNVG
jgi:hypothetical protein